MGKKPENPQAFPRPGFDQPAGLQDGMTLRDYFAGQALAGMLADHGNVARHREIIRTMRSDTLRSVAAGIAYEYADAMLKERSK